MKANNQIPWPRILAEGSAIVVSILLAFAIDAWWEEKQEEGERAEQRQALLNEFEEARTQLEKQLGWLEIAFEGTAQTLELMGADAGEREVTLARPAIGNSLNVGIAVPQQGTLRQVLAARGGSGIFEGELGRMLGAWPVAMDDLRQDSYNLERNREENYIDALVRLGLPMLGVIHTPDQTTQADARIGLPFSQFDVDLSPLLRDPGVETIFAMRALRLQILINSHKRAIAAADEIITLLRDAL